MAVTQLDGSSPVRKSFLTWVEANGSIHHVNLVRLIGFCYDELIKLLVYEHMSNGFWINGYSIKLAGLCSFGIRKRKSSLT